MKWQKECKWAFDIWMSKMNQMKADQIYRAARAIQSGGRLWLERGTMEHMYDLWEAELKRRWGVVRDKFGWTDPKDPYAVTTDKHLFFRTHTDINRYAEFLRKCCNKIWMFFNRKRLRQLKWAVMKWQGTYLSIYLSIYLYTSMLFIDIDMRRPPLAFLGLTPTPSLVLP